MGAGIAAITLLPMGIIFTIIGVGYSRATGGRRKLLETGIPGQATVLSVSGGNVVVNNINVLLTFRMRVTLPGRAPYEVDHRQLTSMFQMAALQVGATVPVMVDPADPSKLTIDLAGEGAASAARRRDRSAGPQDGRGRRRPRWCPTRSPTMSGVAPNTIDAPPPAGYPAAGGYPPAGVSAGRLPAGAGHMPASAACRSRDRGGGHRPAGPTGHHHRPEHAGRRPDDHGRGDPRPATRASRSRAGYRAAGHRRHPVDDRYGCQRAGRVARPADARRDARGRHDLPGPDRRPHPGRRPSGPYRGHGPGAHRPAQPANVVIDWAAARLRSDRGDPGRDGRELDWRSAAEPARWA